MTPPRPGHVFLTTDAIGGVWTYATDLADGLLARGVAVTLAVLGPVEPERLARMRAKGLRVVDTGLPLDWLEGDPAALDAAGERLASLAADSGADLIHLNSPALAAEARFHAPLVGGCHSCLATWWDAVRGGPLPADFLWRTARLARGYARCAALIAPSSAFAEATRARYGVRPTVVRNGRAAPATSRSAKEARVLTSGRLWDDGKNLAALDAAALRMRGRVEAAGPLSGPHGQTVSVQGVEPLGPLGAEAMRERLEAAAVFASLALYEPFGLGVLEAAQARCALVLSDIPTFRELWDGAAVFVDPDDADAVAETLDALLEDTARAEALGAAAAERARRYGLDAMVQGTLGAYASALATVQREAAA